MGAQPHYRIIRKAADGKKWETIGAGWDRDNGEGYSISFEPNGRNGEKIKCLMVKNEPRPADGEPRQLAGKPKEIVNPSAIEDDSIPF